MFLTLIQVTARGYNVLLDAWTRYYQCRLHQLQPWELWAPDVNHTGLTMNLNPQKAFIDSQAEIFADDDLQCLSVGILHRALLFYLRTV